MTIVRPHNPETLFVWNPPRGRYYDIDRRIPVPQRPTSEVRIFFVGTGTRWGSPLRALQVLPLRQKRS